MYKLIDFLRIIGNAYILSFDYIQKIFQFDYDGQTTFFFILYKKYFHIQIFLCVQHVMHKLCWTSENMSRLVDVIATLLFIFLQQDHYEYLIYLYVKIFFIRTKFQRDKIFCGPFFLIYIQTISIELTKVWKDTHKIKRLHSHFWHIKQHLWMLEYVVSYKWGTISFKDNVLWCRFKYCKS